MPLVWQGPLKSVYWPRNAKTEVDLPVELWGPDDSGDFQQFFGCDTSLAFSKYICVSEIALWRILGPPLLLMTRDLSCVEFFNQFASLNEDVALSTTVCDKTNGQTPLGLIIYCARDDTDGSIQIGARILNSELILQPPQPLRLALRPTLLSGDQKSAKQHVKPRATSKSSEHVMDVKSAVQQTVMGALRLRGIRSSNPDFKKMYYAVHTLAEIALRNVNPEKVSVESVKDKVEEILTTID